MKAVSAIIIIVIVLLIAISLALLTYIFFNKVFTTTATSGWGGINNSMSGMSSSLEIESASGNTVYIRNTGVLDLKNFEVYVNHAPVSFSVNPSVVPSNGVAIITINDCMPQSDVDINVVGPDVTAYHKAHNMESCGSCYVNITQSMIPYTITQSNKIYCLVEDAPIDGKTAINFPSGIQNSTLDCRGYNVDGNDTYNTYGVYLIGSSTNSNTVKNCNITDFYNGIYLYSGPNYNTLTNNTANSNDYYGIYLSSSSNNILSNNTANSNSENDIHLDSSSNNTISNNTVTSSIMGIRLDGSSDNQITNNIANINAWGIYITASSNNNKLSNNTISNNSEKGIFISLSNLNSVTGGSVSQNLQDYVFLSEGTTNNFTNINFTAARNIFFADSSSWFNYNNESVGNIWLKTNISDTYSLITRKLVNWNQTLIKWNDTFTNTSGSITARYNITGLSSSTPYRVYNNSVEIVGSPIVTDSLGSLSFTINLPAGQEHEIRVEKPTGTCDFYIYQSNMTNTYSITQSNKLYCLAQDISINGNAIKFDSEYIKNTTVDCMGYNVGGNGIIDTYGFYLTGTSTTNNTIKNCNITNFYIGIYLYSGPSNNTVINNKISGSNVGIYIYYGSGNSILNNLLKNNSGSGLTLFSTSNNSVTNNTIFNNTYGINSYYGSNNTVSIGSINNNVYDYNIYMLGENSNFVNTNFTATRKISFSDTTSWFNYQNDSLQGLWLNTNVYSQATISRTLTNWTQQSMEWNDTSDTAITAVYNIIGLPSTYYNVYDNSNLDYTNLLPDSNDKIRFTINLPANQQHDIRVEKLAL